MRQTSTPLSTGRFRSRMMRSGGRAATAFERRVAAADDFGLGVAAAFERVLDQAGDVLLVFDDENAVLWHAAIIHSSGARFRRRIEAVKCGLRRCAFRCYSAGRACRAMRERSTCADASAAERPGSPCGSVRARRSSLTARPAAPQFVSYLEQPAQHPRRQLAVVPGDAGGATPSASTTTSSTASPQFEVHLGPRREFAHLHGRPGRAPRARLAATTS